ncbi:phosphoribosylformylglycinamidine synthase subunit PurQ [Desulfamplus magnetovallimortis]|nr:phosphoribosylformylglycinamidine synthase subunit PurQ [Desulfamplus magnetovallimortis]
MNRANGKKIKAVVLTGFGLNCDMETAHAFELAGAEAHRVHINMLISGKVDLDSFHILALGGGFSWGDDHGAGVIQALKLKNHLGDQLLSFIDQGKLVIGICNGFQTLVNLGLLPGINGDYKTRSVALTWNDCGNFRDQWVNLSVNPKSPSLFTRGLYDLSSDNLALPVRHAQGKFVADKVVIDTLIDSDQVVLRYADIHGKPAMGKFPENPNGSIHDIAGICDTTGHVFGLMPHPEAYNHFTNHPDWQSEIEILKRRDKNDRSDNRDVNFHGNCLASLPSPGLKIFMNAVNYLSEKFGEPLLNQKS